MQVSTVLGAIVLVFIIMNAAISASRFFKVEGSYMRVYIVFLILFTVLFIVFIFFIFWIL